MRRFVIRRFIQGIAVIFGVSLVTFGLLYVTGDPVALLLPLDASVEQRAEIRSQLGLDDPIVVQYGRFLGGALRGDFGISIRQSEPALDLVLERLPATLELTLTAMALAVVIAVPAGVIAAAKRGTIADQAAMLVALLGQSMPNFWLGIMLLLLFSVQLNWLPPFGRGGIENLILPAITLAMYSMARTARLVRSGLIETLGQDYIRTARAKGLREGLVLRRHALRNSLLPVVTVLGLDLAHLLGGAVITETIFAWPGIGRLAVTAIGARDYPVVQATVFLVAVGYTIANFVVDILYAYLNPRVRFN
ncbi:MAG: ABC transporter permease [Chloroflexi bacterium]|nr:ABC transporter permease [Chloroflexota bacterium]